MIVGFNHLLNCLLSAERKRFELSIPFRGIYAFQAYLFNHSSTSPIVLKLFEDAKLAGFFDLASRGRKYQS